MATNRAFFPQEAVDVWLAEGRVSLEGQVLGLLPDGPSFVLTSAVLFRSEVAAGDDSPGLCGKVKTLAAVEALSGEHASGSVVLGDHAYEVVDGFVGELVESGAGLSAAGLSVTGLSVTGLSVTGLSVAGLSVTGVPATTLAALAAYG